MLLGVCRVIIDMGKEGYDKMILNVLDGFREGVAVFPAPLFMASADLLTAV